MQSQNKAAAHKGDDAPTRNELRVAATRGKICRAVVHCLDDLGYSETSINRVQQRAGVSRGALTHHFPDKEAMMVETLERLLDPVRGQPNAGRADRRDVIARTVGQGGGIEGDLARLWSRVVNTREGRALVEILVASRTDAALRRRIAPSLQAYNADFGQNILGHYRSADADDDDVVLLWSICRTFLRGLHTHAPFESGPDAVDRMIARFAALIAPHMVARGDSGGSR